MESNDGKGPGDAPGQKKNKRTPSARKRAPKAAKAEQNGTGLADREPREAPPAQDQADGTERSPRETNVSTPRAADQADSGDHGDFSNGDAERAADLAADLKSWMDTRQEDRGVRGEVL
jgi:hypothetical protein